MEFAGEKPRTFERPKIGDVLDHAERAIVATRIGANAARVGRVHVAADRTGREPLVDRLQRGTQRFERGGALLEEAEDSAPGRPRAKPGGAGKGLSQRLDLGGAGKSARLVSRHIIATRSPST